MTLFKLILPLKRIILRLAFDLRLFFGPGHSFLAKGPSLSGPSYLHHWSLRQRETVHRQSPFPVALPDARRFVYRQRSSPFGTARNGQTSRTSTLFFAIRTAAGRKQSAAG